MKRAWRRIAALGSSVLLATSVATGQPAPMAPMNAGAPTPMVSAQEQEIQQLLGKLTELSNRLSKDTPPADVYRYQVAQTEVMLQLAVRSTGKEREDWLRMAIDSQYAAAIQAPDSDPTAYQRLQLLPGQINQAFPGSRAVTYALLQEIQASYMKALSKAGDNPGKAQLLLRDRLLHFAETYPNVEEAPKAVMEAAQLSEQLNRHEDARKCYAYLTRRYAGTPTARKAEGIQWRLGGEKTEVQLRLPYIYATSARGEQQFDLNQLRGKLVVVFFWSTSSPAIDQEFQALKALTDRYQFHGVEVVYVNLDDDPVQVREYLSGKLLAGTQVSQRGGLNSEVAQRFGIKKLPEAFVVGREGQLLKHSLTAAQLEAEVAGQLKAKK